jgi:hypothetical protein
VGDTAEGGVSSVAYTDNEYEQFALFVDWLEDKRKQARLSQDELAKLGGVSKDTYPKLPHFRNRVLC